jgi:hypothetical protein
VVPEGIFDALSWCASDVLEWRCPASWDAGTTVDGSDPARMVFVLRPGPFAFLPTELAAVHAFGLGLAEEQALAPWGIDAATDGLFAHRVRPRDALWLAADNLNALFWGLHDWAHFHNHGAFEPHQRPWTEVQCDVSALAWLWTNRQKVPLTEAAWERMRGEVLALSRKRFEEAGQAFDDEALTAERVRELAGDGEGEPQAPHAKTVRRRRAEGTTRGGPK